MFKLTSHVTAFQYSALVTTSRFGIYPKIIYYVPLVQWFWLFFFNYYQVYLYLLFICLSRKLKYYMILFWIH